MSAVLKEVKVKFKIAVVPVNMLDFVWDQVEPLIEAVAVKVPEDIVTSIVKDRLYYGTVLLVTVSKGSKIVAVNILDIHTLDSGTKVLYIPVTSGKDLHEWLDSFLEIAKSIAKDYSCSEIRASVIRKGWLRVLEKREWDEVFTTIRYRIGD